MTSQRYEEILAPKLYFDITFDIDAARILPGGYYATPSDMMLVLLWFLRRGLYS